jgi:ATP-dependent Clp protease adaptor protein ClpS
MSEGDQSDTAVAEPVVRTKSQPKAKTGTVTETRRQPPYNVIILNDDFHTFQYVIELLMKLFAHPLSTAQALAIEIDAKGRAVVYTTHKEKAELKRDQIIGYGPDPWARIRTGPLGCYIEPAPMD